ncbi:unnamed protein product [Closterium sp. NIES-64]|nr:unnamed protein product [Closterium sp. NIES-64]
MRPTESTGYLQLLVSVAGLSPPILHPDCHPHLSSVHSPVSSIHPLPSLHPHIDQQALISTLRPSPSSPNQLFASSSITPSPHPMIGGAHGAGRWRRANIASVRAVSCLNSGLALQWAPLHQAN